MSNRNAIDLMNMLVHDFGMKVGNLVSPDSDQLIRSWSVQGATPQGFQRAFEVAIAKEWLAPNLNSWVITAAGYEVATQ